jgi:hypothetical protein
MIFAGKYVQQQWFPDDKETRFSNWYFETSSKGWITDDIALKWLLGLFIPHTKPLDRDQWRLLILDGHGSHTTAEFLSECLFHKIWLIILPAHASHIF